MRKAPIMMFLTCMVMGLTACATGEKKEIKLEASKPGAIAQTKEPEAKEADESNADEQYSVFTNCSKEEVETFAKEVKEEIIDSDWKSLAKKMSFPLVFDCGDGEQITLQDDKFYEALDLGSALSDAFIEAIKRESCTDLFANYQGCMLGDGQVWISEQLDSSGKSLGLKVIAINN